METIAVTGFYGSGKTTLLILLARYLMLEKKKVAIIQNEIGKIGVDDLRLGMEGHPVEELLGGCICCSLQSSLVVTISNIVRDYNPDVLLLEASGQATPKVLRNILECVDSESTGLTFLSMLDAARLKRIDDYLDLPFIMNAIESADIIVLNKVEQVDPAQLTKLREQTIQANKKAILAETTLRDQAELPPLLKMLIANRNDRVREPQTATHVHEHHDHDHDHVHVHGEPVVLGRQRIISPSGSISPDRLRDSMNQFNTQLSSVGAELIGHVKVFLEDRSGQYLQTNLTDLAVDSTVDGDATLSGPVTCTVNAIVFGITEEQLGLIIDHFLDHAY